jgi:hypothetical protein
MQTHDRKKETTQYCEGGYKQGVMDLFGALIYIGNFEALIVLIY